MKPPTTCNKEGCDETITWARTQDQPGRPGRFVAVDADADGAPVHRGGRGGLEPTGDTTDEGVPIVRNVRTGAASWSCHWSTCAAKGGRVAG